jgi:Ca-activated chloride channel family protein
MLTQRKVRTRKLLPFQLLFAVLFSSTIVWAQQTQDEADVVRVNADLVVLNVTVTDGRGEYVHNLRKSDFKIYEDAHEQTIDTISTFSVEETPFAAAILLDTSGSMEGRLTLARSAAIRFLDGLRTDDVAAVYRFDTDTEQVQEFSPSRDLAPIAFNLKAKGMTVLNDAVARAARDLAARPEKRRAIIILSDGADTHSKLSEDKALEQAMAADIMIYAVDMSKIDNGTRTDPQSAAALKTFASKTGGRYIATPGGQALRDAFASIVEELSNQYTIGYRPQNRARDGHWRTLEVKIPTHGDATARTRKGYRAPKQ